MAVPLVLTLGMCSAGAWDAPSDPAKGTAMVVASGATMAVELEMRLVVKWDVPSDLQKGMAMAAVSDATLAQGSGRAKAAESDVTSAAATAVELGMRLAGAWVVQSDLKKDTAMVVG